MREEDKKGILLESGTNEIEIMEFTIAGNLYGINVAKVREIMMSAPVKAMPHAHPAVEGVFKPRDTVLTVVNLPKYLDGALAEKGEKDIFIVTNFNKMYIAFRVHTVVGISRISWKDIQKPDSTVSGGDDGVTTGIAQCRGELVTILDFEKIVAEIAPQTSIQMSEIDRMGYRECREMPILVAEDSILLHDDVLDECPDFPKILLAVIPTYAPFGVTEVTCPQWEAVGALTETAGGTARELYDEANVWAQEVFRTHDCFTILGI